MTLKQMRPGKAQSSYRCSRPATARLGGPLIAGERLPNSVFDSFVTQVMHITGTATPFDFLISIARHSLEGILHHVEQDILLSEGEQDHLFNVDWIYRAMRELVCARR